MTYQLGIDLGTTYTAAAIADGGRVEALSLGTRSSVLPTVVFARDDGELLVGEAAETRGVREPARVAREFKRRLGDTAPLVLGGVPYPVEALMGAVLAHVRQAAVERMGGEPAHVVITHPATYSNYRLDLLRDAVRRAGLTSVEFLTEPQAAATHYASLDRVATGDVIAVYDLGGGTFDAAIVRNTSNGFELLGQPQGLERLGGIDFDIAVLEHVNDAMGSQLTALADDDPAVRAGLARLRADARHAKETLSRDTDTTIPLIVPGVVGEVAMSRAEFEHLVTPRIRESIAVLRQALRSSNLEATDLASVLLVGGSSRIPAVRRMVTEALHVRVTSEVDPEMAVALGAARHAAGIDIPAVVTSVPPITPPASPPASPPTAPPIAAPPGVFSPPAPPPVPRTRKPVAIIAAAAVAAVALVAFLATRGGGDDGSTTESQPEQTTEDTTPDETAPEGLCAEFLALMADASSTLEQLQAAPPTDCDLTGLDARERDLTGITFSGADLTGSRFDGATLDGARFDGADLQQVNFTGASMTGVDLTGASAPGAVFDSVDLTGSAFVSVDCSGCSFEGTVFVGSDLAGTNFAGANLTLADVASTGIEGMTIDDTTKLGPAPGAILLVDAGTASGNLDAATTVLSTLGYSTTAFDGSLPLQTTTSLSCRGAFFGSEMRKLLIAMDQFFLGDVQEVDFSEIENAMTIDDDEIPCVILLGADLVPA